MWFACMRAYLFCVFFLWFFVFFVCFFCVCFLCVWGGGGPARALTHYLRKLSYYIKTAILNTAHKRVECANVKSTKHISGAK